MLKIVKILKYAMYVAPIIFMFNFFEYNMEFFTFGLTGKDPFKGEYALITLAFSLCFYVFFILDSLANTTKKEIAEDLTHYYITERKKGTPVDVAEAQIKKLIYAKYKPKKMKFIYKDVIISMCEALEKPFALQEEYKGDIYERAKDIDADGAGRKLEGNKKVEEDHSKQVGGASGTVKISDTEIREPKPNADVKDVNKAIKRIKDRNNGSNLAHKDAINKEIDKKVK